MIPAFLSFYRRNGDTLVVIRIVSGADRGEVVFAQEEAHYFACAVFRIQEVDIHLPDGAEQKFYVKFDDCVGKIERSYAVRRKRFQIGYIRGPGRLRIALFEFQCAVAVARFVRDSGDRPFRTGDRTVFNVAVSDFRSFEFPFVFVYAHVVDPKKVCAFGRRRFAARSDDAHESRAALFIISFIEMRLRDIDLDMPPAIFALDLFEGDALIGI